MTRFVPEHDSTFVSRMKSAGFAILGRSSSSEFGNQNETTLHGPTNNPWDRTRSTGGSSAGSAASVAARLVPLAHGSDGGGSIRLPASWCGVFGLKPTRGRNPFGPDETEGCGDLLVDHVLTWSVRDSAAALDAISGPDAGAVSVPPRQAGSFVEHVSQDPPRLRIGFATATPMGLPSEPACRDALLEAATLCEELGHVVEEASPAYDAATLLDEFDGIWADMNAANVTEWSRMLKKELTLEDLGETTRFMIERGLARTAVQHMTGVARMQRVARDAAEFFATYDMWLTPTAPTVAQPHEALTPDKVDFADFCEREGETGAFLSGEHYWAARHECAPLVVIGRATYRCAFHGPVRERGSAAQPRGAAGASPLVARSSTTERLLVCTAPSRRPA